MDKHIYLFLRLPFLGGTAQAHLGVRRSDKVQAGERIAAASLRHTLASVGALSFVPRMSWDSLPCRRVPRLQQRGPTLRRTSMMGSLSWPVAPTLMAGHGRAKRPRPRRKACDVVHSAVASRETGCLQKEGGIPW